MIDITQFAEATAGLAEKSKKEAIIADLREVDDPVFQIAVNALASNSVNALTGEAWNTAAGGLLELKKQHEMGVR